MGNRASPSSAGRNADEPLFHHRDGEPAWPAASVAWGLAHGAWDDQIGAGTIVQRDLLVIDRNRLPALSAPSASDKFMRAGEVVVWLQQAWTQRAMERRRPIDDAYETDGARALTRIDARRSGSSSA